MKEEKLGLFGYVNMSEEWMLKVVGEALQVGETKWEYKKRVDKQRKDILKEKMLHGKFLTDIKVVADARFWQWIRGGYLAKNTEAYVFAAQEQALRTRFIMAKIDGEDIDPLCRICGKDVETVAHVASICGGLAQNQYKTRHNRMGLRVY